jgi:hypothetical protein
MSEQRRLAAIVSGDTALAGAQWLRGHDAVAGGTQGETGPCDPGRAQHRNSNLETAAPRVTPPA